MFVSQKGQALLHVITASRLCMSLGQQGQKFDVLQAAVSGLQT